MNRTYAFVLSIAVSVTLIACSIACSSVQAFTQTREETRAAAEKAFNAAVELSESNKEELVPAALSRFQEAQHLYHQIDEKRGEANALRGVARSYLRLKRRDEAVAAYKHALRLFQTISRTKAIMRVHIEIAEIYDDSSDPDSLRVAVEHFETALPMFTGDDDKREHGITLMNAGRAHMLLGNVKRSMELSHQALDFFPAPEDKQIKADILSNFANASQIAGGVEDRRRAAEYFGKAIELYSAVGNKESENGKAHALLNRGNSLISLGQREAAINSYRRALELYRELGYHFGAAIALENIGDAYAYWSDEKTAPQALNLYLEAAKILRDNKEQAKEGELLAKAGSLSFRLKNKEWALTYSKQAQAVYADFSAREPLFKTHVAWGFVAIGAVYEHLGSEAEKPLARENYAKARAIYVELYDSFRLKDDRQNRVNQVAALKDMADASLRMKDRGGALEAYGKAVAVCKQIPDEDCEAGMLSAIAGVYAYSDDAEDNRRAITHYRAAKQLFGKRGNRDGEVWALHRIASTQEFLSAWQPFLQTCSELLAIADTLEPARGDFVRAEANLRIGDAYQALDDQKVAAERFEQALSYAGKVRDRELEARALARLTQAYFILGNSAKLLDRAQKLLSVLSPEDEDYYGKKGFGHLMRSFAYHSLGDVANSNEEMRMGIEALQQAGVEDEDVAAVTSILKGNLHLLKGEKERERSQFEETVKGLANIRDDGARSFALYYLALSLSEANNYDRALEYAQQGLALSRKTDNRNFEAIILLMVGFIKWEQDKNDEAVDAFQQSLLVFNENDARWFEVIALTGLMDACRDARNPRLAIFYGKQAAKGFQELRGTAKELDNELQKGYVRRIANLYSDLTTLLLSEGRPAEAQQVINLARDQALFDLGGGQNQVPAQVQFTPREREHSLAWAEALAKAGQALRESSAVGRNESGRAEAPGARQLEVSQTKHYGEYLATLRRIGEDFKRPADARDRLHSVSDTEKMQNILRELGSTTRQKPAVLYTFTGDDKFHILLNTPDGEVEAFETPVKEGDLDSKLLQFYALLQSKVYDPRKLGKELYDIIIPKALEAKLRGEGVEVLVWSLDGNLRYIPMAALSPDGKQYLIERYGSVVLTRVEADRMTRKVSPDWTGYGFFTTGPRTVKVEENIFDFPALDKREAEVFRTAAYPQGVVGGETFSDTGFTQAALLNVQRERRPLIHISSHFRFHPGSLDLSFLLLGDGRIMPMSELKKRSNIFQGVDLLILSACDTAAQFPNADGKEIDAFAELAQRLGAGSVMASLWSVSDVSTTRLMKGFYSHRQAGRLNKAEALRQSQLDLLYGRQGEARNAADVQDGETKKGDFAREDIFVEERYRVNFTKGHRYAHPYYWSPFVLFGNWK